MIAEAVTGKGFADVPTPRITTTEGPAFHVESPAGEIRQFIQDAGSGTALPDITTEGRIVADAQSDPAEFGPLYERYVDQVYRYIYRRVGSHQEAEDLTSQTFQQALAALPGYEWRGLPFGAWLFRIAGNLVIRHRRLRSREVAVEDVAIFHTDSGREDDLIEMVANSEAAEVLVAAIRQLPMDQQRAIMLKFSHGLKNHEVGARMGRSEGAIKQLVHRAIVALRDLLKDEAVLKTDAPRIAS